MKHKHSGLIKKWADGAIIQFLSHDNQWKDCLNNNPTWREAETYRVKPSLEPWQEALVEAIKNGKQVEYSTGYGWEPADLLVSFLLIGRSLDKYSWYTQDCYRVKPESRFVYAYEAQDGHYYMSSRLLTTTEATEFFAKLKIENYQQLQTI